MPSELEYDVRYSYSCRILVGASPTLSDKTVYALFSRTVAPVTSKGQTLIALMRRVGMSKVVVLTSTETLWFQGGLELTATLQAAGVQVLRPAAFEPGLDVYAQETTLSHIKRSGYWCVMLIAYDAEVHALASTAQHQKMLNTGWAWILPWTDRFTAPLQQLGWLYVRPYLATEHMQAFAEQVSDYSTASYSSTQLPLPTRSILYIAQHCTMRSCSTHML